MSSKTAQPQPRQPNVAFTTNLFRSCGPGDHSLEVVDGTWPTDIAGDVLIVGPDKRKPGGHWFNQQGIVTRISCVLDSQGRIPVSMRRVQTPLARIRDRVGFLFKTFSFVQVSPFGVSNLANTNVVAIDDRVFIGYDAGRQVEIDRTTLEYRTPIGSTSEWVQTMPGPLEPAIAVAAHPAADFEEHAIYFVNYSMLPGKRSLSVARWGLSGPVDRWPLRGEAQFDWIHDVKSSRDYLVISDLPFVVEPASFGKGKRKVKNPGHTTLIIVAKADLATTPPGKSVPMRVVEIPYPTGHLSVEYENPEGQVVVNLEHIAAADLMLTVDSTIPAPMTGECPPSEVDGMVELGVQPLALGRYRIDVDSGAVEQEQFIWDDRVWGSILYTMDESTSAARSRRVHLWAASLGFHPGLVSQQWFDLYGDGQTPYLVHPDELPKEGRPPVVAHFDLEHGAVTDVFEYRDGSFATPPTFVPRRGTDSIGDGYIVLLVHRDGDKEVHVFDAADLAKGPIARASAVGFNPPLQLHSWWAPPCAGAPASEYRVPIARDVLGAVIGGPGVMLRMVRSMLAIRSAIQQARASGRAE